MGNWQNVNDFYISPKRGSGIDLTCNRLLVTVEIGVGRSRRVRMLLNFLALPTKSWKENVRKRDHHSATSREEWYSLTNPAISAHVCPSRAGLNSRFQHQDLWLTIRQPFQSMSIRDVLYASKGCSSCFEKAYEDSRQSISVNVPNIVTRHGRWICETQCKSLASLRDVVWWPCLITRR